VIQIEWQCDVPFKVSAIKKVTDEDHMHGFHNYKGQDEPFVKTLDEMNTRGGGPDKPIRSGPTKNRGRKILSRAMETTL
jgi:hypothetical protein